MRKNGKDEHYNMYSSFHDNSSNGILAGIMYNPADNVSEGLYNPRHLWIRVMPYQTVPRKIPMKVLRAFIGKEIRKLRRAGDEVLESWICTSANSWTK